MSNDVLTIGDIRKAGYCVRKGAKAKCDALGLDFKRLIREGLPLEEMRAIDDLHVQTSVKQADARIAAEKAAG